MDDNRFPVGSRLKDLLSKFRSITGPSGSNAVALPMTTEDEVDQLKGAFEIAAQELQQAHNDLKASETKYRLMFEASQDAIIIVDGQEAVRDINSAGSGKDPNIEEVVQASDIPEQIRKDYRCWVALLIAHYRDLIRAHGSSYPALVRSVYKSHTNFLLFLNCLNQVEREFDAALKPPIAETTENANGIIKLMEESTGSIRRQIAEEIFP